MPDTASYRLPRAVLPERYELEIAPDLDEASFEGRVTIRVQVEEPVSEVVLNAAELEVTSARLEGSSGEDLQPRISFDEGSERLILGLPELLPAGTWDLHLEFCGILNDKLKGFYRSTFETADGSTAVIATTQFEPADARRAFPCWDEPDFKATFAVSLVVGEDLTAISNGSAVAEEPAGAGRRKVRFAETMPMSTYLVAFVVGPFELTEPQIVDGVPLRVAAVPGKSGLTGFGIEAGKHALHFLAGYFGLPYPHDKIDHVAIPDFAFGAMENLGCVTYRETALLADPAAASQLELRRIAEVVAHETAHMWFGDLVTMKWWNGIWLNEAFATFMEITTTDDFRPEWKLWTAFGVAKAAALVTDGLKATRPIEFPVGPPEEAEAMFDVLTYEKGGSVLRMLEQYLGAEEFRKGIAAYLREHQHSNTETTDLWDAIEASSGEPVRSIMDSWIFQGGYPLVSAALGDDGRSLELSQRRFLYAGGSPAGDGSERWSVPINLRASVDGEVVRDRTLLSGESATLTFDGTVDWVLVNDGAWGFYRVAYSPDLLRRLIAAIPQLEPLERMALVGDVWARVVSGDADLAQWVEVAQALSGEEDPDVWLTLLAPLDLLDVIASEEDRGVLTAFVRRMARPVFERIGWDPLPGEDQRRGTIRSRLIAALGTLGADEEVRAEAASRFERYRQDRSSLHPDVVTAVAHVVAAAGGPEAYETMLEELHAAVTPQEKIRYLYALAQPDDEALLRRTLDACLTPEVRSQDAPMVIGRVLSRREGRLLAWPWIEDHWEEALARFPSNIVIRMVEGITSLTDAGLSGRARDWLAAHPVPGAGARQEQLLEHMQINVALAGRLAPRLAGDLR